MRRLLRITSLGLMVLIGQLWGSAEAMDRSEVIAKMKEMRPPNLMVLIERPDVGGNYLLGMYAVERDTTNKDLRRYKLWQEWPTDLNIHSETVSCDVEEPLRVARDGQSIYVRRLNPGGDVVPASREDHLVWWAACVPDMAGTDPVSLKETALSLGYSTVLVESQEVLRVPDY